MVGFYVKNEDTFEAKFRCLTCLLILRDPVQLPCGDRQCKSCIDTTDRESIKCVKCKEGFLKKEAPLDRGFKNDMKTLPVACCLCDWTGLFDEYETHLEKAHPNPLCEYCGKQFDSPTNLDLHKLAECANMLVPCCLHRFGCSDSVMRSQMAAHYMTEQHQNTILTIVCGSISKPVAEQCAATCSTEMDISPHSTTTMNSSINDYPSAQLEEFYKTTDILAGGIQALNDDGQRLSNEALQLHIQTEVMNSHLAALKLSIQEEQHFFNGLKPNQDILNQDVASMKQNVEDLQSVSYDGTLTWKITSFKEKMTDAQSERQTSIYSPPFYSSPTGYKMRARLYLHGDGNARRTHMSLFFVLMRSEHDGILKFPFNYKVTFCMYDQTPNQRHIIDSFRPDVKSNSFQRPRSEMNIASGIPKFFPLALIQQEGNPYVQEDTMFIKIMVDFGEIPKTVLPYTFTLNPGLPVFIRQKMIKEEIERRTQQTPTSSGSSAQSTAKKS